MIAARGEGALVDGALEPSRDLLCRARGGDQEAFCDLVELHQRQVTRLADRLLDDADLADSVTQEAFVRAWRRLARFRGECSFGTWVGRIAVNLCRDHLKRKDLVISESRLASSDRRSDPEGASPLSLAADAGPDPESRTMGREIGRKIAREAARLPRRQREIFALRFYQDLPLAEIAALFGIDVGTVKTHLHRATRRVRGSLEADYGQRLPI